MKNPQLWPPSTRPASPIDALMVRLTCPACRGSLVYWDYRPTKPAPLFATAWTAEHAGCATLKAA